MVINLCCWLCNPPTKLQDYKTLTLVGTLLNIISVAFFLEIGKYSGKFTAQYRKQPYKPRSSDCSRTINRKKQKRVTSIYEAERR